MVIVLILAGLALFLGVAFWYGLRGEPNEPPALGHNFPYPSTAWGHVPSADDIQAEPDRHPAPQRHHPRPASSWMDEPGAMEQAGLVDETPPPDQGTPPAP